eukprot:CAMPEP_0184503382 /NCGR_PEP_ID=MMETSP0113_2-20130426/51859_1 /TAXON_ID=91329 /ORGANISM="Norrisiella sphaerica, Strain BC52" /LENGTH=328 /DNA_ID=CAMNT_0026892869 /DNA_START=98 /DNA_END=1084 /DNA_ORIENTATION=-
MQRGKGANENKLEASIRGGKGRGSGRKQKARDKRKNTSSAAPESVRGEYQIHGVENYYAKKGQAYINPHDLALNSALALATQKWAGMRLHAEKLENVRQMSSVSSKLPTLSSSADAQSKCVLRIDKCNTILDLASGSGEATLALEKCREGLIRLRRRLGEAERHREGKCESQQTRNLELKIMTQEGAGNEKLKTRDLNLGTRENGGGKSGEKEKQEGGEQREAIEAKKLHVTATDPYTYEAFEKRTGKKCERFSFKDVSNGCYSERRFEKEKQEGGEQREAIEAKKLHVTATDPYTYEVRLNQTFLSSASSLQFHGHLKEASSHTRVK